MKAYGILGQVEHLQGAQLLQLRPCGQLINAVLVEEKEAQLLHGHQHSGQLSQSIPLEIKVHQIGQQQFFLFFLQSDVQIVLLTTIRTIISILF